MGETTWLFSAIRSVFNTNEDFHSVDGRYLVYFDKANPQQTYQDILTALGSGKQLLKDDFTSQMISMLHQTSFWKNEQCNKVVWHAPNLKVRSMYIEMKKSEHDDRVVIDLTYCFVTANLKNEWSWNRKTKATKCLQIVHERLDALLKGAYHNQRHDLTIKTIKSYSFNSTLFQIHLIASLFIGITGSRPSSFDTLPQPHTTMRSPHNFENLLLKQTNIQIYSFPPYNSTIYAHSRIN